MKNEITNTNKELKKITKTIAFDIPELKNLSNEQLEKIAEYEVVPKVIKDVLKENKFPTHKINDELN